MTFDLKDESNKPRIRFTKGVYGETTLIDGATFELYVVDETNGTLTTINSNGDQVKLSPVLSNGKIVTIDSGTALDNNGKEISGQGVTPKLEPGKTYYLKEVALQGPNLNWDFYFDEENCWTRIDIPADSREEKSVTIYNYRKTHLPGEKYAEDEKTPLSGSLLLVFRDEAHAIKNGGSS